MIPNTLATASVGDVAYLCIDLNVAEPERAALAHFWPKLVRGEIVVFDDYGWTPYYLQKRMHDAFAASQGVDILMLPTGQGLLIKP
jgi:O-methyltransferase